MKQAQDDEGEVLVSIGKSLTGPGHAPVKLKPIVEKDGSTTEHDLEERLRAVVRGAIGALPSKLRRQAEAQLQTRMLGQRT